MRRWYSWPGMLLACFLLEWVFSTWTILGATPLMGLIVTIAVSVMRGPVAGETFGFTSGFLRDAMTTHLFGANALIQALAGYSVGMMRRQMDVSMVPSQMALVAVVSLVHYVLLSLLGSVFLDRSIEGPLQGLILLPLYNALAAPVVFYAVTKLKRNDRAE